MKRLQFAFSLLAFSFLLNSCIDCVRGEGEPVEEDRTVADFEHLVVEHSADVTIYPISVSDQNKVIVEAQENLIPYIKTDVEGKKLVIHGEGCINATERIHIHVYCSQLEKITNDGSGNLDAIEVLKWNELNARNYGSGSLEFEFKGEELELENSGSGGIEVTGSVDKLSVENSGSGSTNALDLQANEVEVDCSGSGGVKVHAKDELSIDLSGSGSVKYKGDPQTIEQSATGSGRVKHLD